MLFVSQSYAVRGLDGSFLAINNTNASWSLSRWGEELAYMRSVNMNTVICWCSVYSTNSYYTSCSLPGVTFRGEPLKKILTIADTTGMSVILGLWADDYWWSNEQNTTYLTSICNKSKIICNELWSQFSTYPSLKGWYFWQEIDNLNQVNEPDRVNLVTYFLRPLSDYCKAKTPGKWVCEAPFFNDALQQPPAYEIWWEKTLTEVTSLNLIIPQDGIGVNHASFSTLSAYFQALKNACDSTSRTMWSDLELFDSGGNPAPISRITSQILVENQYVNGFVSWEYISCMSPNSGSAQAQLYNDYKTYITGTTYSIMTNVALSKPYTINPIPSPSYPDSGGELTDGQSPYNWTSQVGWTNPASYPTVIVDLQSVYSNLTTVIGYCMRDDGSAVNAPQYLIVSTSNNGTSYSFTGNATCSSPTNGAINPYRLDRSLFSGRYIKLNIVPQGTAWTMINEVVVYEQPVAVELSRFYFE
jgi:hypothetical protein